MSEPPKTTLGKYEIREEIGKGAMGVVYLGFDPTLERRVALKVMASAIVSDPDLKGRFEREARSAAKLHHPNIVTVYDLGYDAAGVPYIAMEFLSGKDLEHHIRRKTLSLPQKLDIVAQSCRGLAHAHDRGIIHRDVKPANIFITDSGEAKILDFGIARGQTSSQTQTGVIMGTADYMSPEQIKGPKVDARSDIFSMGVILYRILSNKKPFAASSMPGVLHKIMRESPPPLLLPGGGQVPELQAVLDRALAKDAADRYATADDLADDVTELFALFSNSLEDEAIFETVEDPVAEAEERGSGAPTSGRSTSRSGRVLGSTTPPASVSRTERAGAGRPAQVGPTRLMARTNVRPASSRVGIPISDSGGWWKYLAVAAALVGLGASALWWSRSDDAVAVQVDSEARPPEATAGAFDTRLARVRAALEGGLLNVAQNEVESILLEDPTNEEARSLKAQVDARQRQAVAVVPSEAPRSPAPLPPSSGPTTLERANKIAAEASMAIGAGDLDRADALIRDGRRVDPENPFWRQLARQLELADRRRSIDRHVGEAAARMTAGDYEGAIESYDRALEYDPNDVQLITGRSQATLALDRQRTAAAVAALELQESDTELIAPDRGGEQAPSGFQEGEVRVERATSAPDTPAEIVVQIQPVTVQPGDPFELRVRIHNVSNRPLIIKTLELVSTYGTKPPTGRGQPLTPMVQNINPRDTTLIWQTRGTWSEDQRTGRIEATVTLAGNAKLKKTVRWR